jgi:hypothetical protein
LQGRFKSAS